MQGSDNNEIDEEVHFVGEDKVKTRKERARELKGELKDHWFKRWILLPFLLFAFAVTDYYLFMVYAKNENWMATLIIGIFQILALVIYFHSVRKVFRLILSTFIKN